MFEKKISLVESKLNRVNKGLETARSTNNLQLLAFNVRQGFNGSLLKSLYLIKQGESAEDELNQAVSFYVSNADLIDGQSTDLPADRINILSYLLGKDKVDVEDFYSDSPDRRLDYLLGEALYGIDVADKWKQALELLGQNKEANLAVETYRNYWDILHSEMGDASALNPLKGLGEELFSKRKRDSFFGGADQSEGGAEDNDYVVDYRLLAVLKNRVI